MTSEHLSVELRSDYLQGVSAPGAALAVEAHIAFCEQCRRAADWTERQDQALGRLHHLEKRPTAGLPAPLGHVATGRWRRVAEGVRRAPLPSVSGLGESVHLLKAAPDAPLMLPAATHLLVVLQGAIRTAATIYSPGDLIETAGIRLREARAHSASSCVCLVVGDDDVYEELLVDRPERLRA